MFLDLKNLEMAIRWFTSNVWRRSSRAKKHLFFSRLNIQIKSSNIRSRTIIKYLIFQFSMLPDGFTTDVFSTCWMFDVASPVWDWSTDWITPSCPQCCCAWHWQCPGWLRKNHGRNPTKKLGRWWKSHDVESHSHFHTGIRDLRKMGRGVRYVEHGSYQVLMIKTAAH